MDKDAREQASRLLDIVHYCAMQMMRVCELSGRAGEGSGIRTKETQKGIARTGVRGRGQAW